LLSGSLGVLEIGALVFTDESLLSFSAASLEMEVGILEGGTGAASGGVSSDSETT
jgi:hypothetical protein